MGRLTVVAVAVALGGFAASACAEDHALGDFGGACNIDDQCASGLACPKSVKQCTKDCTSAGDCAALAGNATCFQGHCFAACASTDECPHGAVCNNLGWCGTSEQAPSAGGAPGQNGGSSAGGAAAGGASPGGTGGASGGTGGAAGMPSGGASDGG